MYPFSNGIADGFFSYASGPLYMASVENKKNVMEFILHGLMQDETVGKVSFSLFLVF